MTLSQLLILLRARSNIILWTLLTLLLLATTAYLLLPASYRATTSLVLNYKGVGPHTGTGQLSNYVTTQLDVIRSVGVARQVVSSLKLSENPKWRERFEDAARGREDFDEWAAERLLKKLSVVPGRDSAVIQISFRDEDPQFAATVANAFAQAYEQMNFQLRVNPLKTTEGYFSEHLIGLRETLTQAQAKVSQFRRDKGITSDQSHLDAESERLIELNKQLVAVQAQMMEENSRQKQAQGVRAAQSPQILADPLTQTLKTQLTEAEARLNEISQRYTEQHPQYQSALADVAKRRSALQTHIRTSASGIANQAQILQSREAELSQAVEQQKERVLALNQSRDELVLLNKELEDAQRAYETAAQRMLDASIDGFTPPEVAILSVAAPPAKPHGPGLLLALIAAAALGIIVGVGLALLAELRDRRVRSAADVLELVGLPVLGEVDFSGDRLRITSVKPLIGNS